MKLNFRVVLIAAFIEMTAVFPVYSAQLQQVPQGPPPPYTAQPVPDDETRIKMEKDLAKRANRERQEQLKKDTDQLFRLATELKDSVDKSNENTLSLDVIKKADEIERLAHNVKEKMRGSY